MAFAHYTEQGTGPAVIFNHGTLMDGTMFEPQLDFLARHGWRAISLNSRVLTGPPARHTLEDLADDTAALAEQLNLSDCVVAGMSVGAFTALDFALKYKDRAAGYILISGQACAYPETDQQVFEQEFARFDVDGMVSNERAQWAAPFCFGPHAWTHNRALVDDWIHRWTTRIPSRAVWAQGTSWVHKPDLTERLREIDKPVLILHGADDVPVPIARACQMLEHIKDVTFVKVPNAGHTVNLENPTVVNHAIKGFLERLFA